MTADNDDTWKPPYTIASRTVPSKPGCWEVQEVEILHDGIAIGKYTYDYHMRTPWCPFEIDGQWYALYSKNYTASSIMKLPECVDVWSEEPNSSGFCPVEFYVPATQKVIFGGDRTNKSDYTLRTDPEGFSKPGKHPTYDWTFEPPKYYKFAFVCGCVWGDDSSWKIQFYDLSELPQGKVTYDSRFGYVEMHPKLSLAESVRIQPGEIPIIGITTEQLFNTDGTEIEPD